MAQLDQLIQQLHEQHADMLKLTAGEPAVLQENGAVHALTREPLSGAQIVTLAREIAPTALAAQVSAEASLAFGYTAPSGGVEAELWPSAEGLQLLVRRVGAPAPAAVDEAREDMDTLLRELSLSGASDLHLHTGEPPAFRRRGELIRSHAPPFAAAWLEAMLASIMPANVRDTFRERQDADWVHEIEGVARFRCNAGRDRYGPFAVVRVIPLLVPTADELGLSQAIQELCSIPSGLVLVTGPRGSGKSTTLAAMVDLINRTRTDHILTIEEPIEFVHERKRGLVTQREVGVHTRSFGDGLRAAQREDPDIVVVGALDDADAVLCALELAETGHLVLATMQTRTPAATIDRIIEQFPPGRQGQVRALLADTLRAIISQELERGPSGAREATRQVLFNIPAVADLIRESRTYQIPAVMRTLAP